MSIESDGATDYYTTPGAAPEIVTGNVTLSAWVILDSSAGAGRAIFSRGTWPILWYAADIAGTNFLSLWSDTYGDSFSTSGIATAAYTHLAVVRTGATCRHFFNGAFDAISAAVGAFPGGAAPLIIFNNFGIWDGIIEDLRMYNRALSDAEIMTMYNQRGHDGIVNGLVYKAPMDELSPGTAVGATSVLDVSSTRDNSDAINGAPTYRASRLSMRRRIA